MGEPAVFRRDDAAEPPDQGTYEARLVPVREPFTCAIGGRRGSAVALRIRHRNDSDVPSLLLDPGAVIAVIRAGVEDLDHALDHVAGPSTDVAGTAANGDDSGLWRGDAVGRSALR